MKNSIALRLTTFTLAIFATACSHSLPQRDLDPSKAKSQGYYLSPEESASRGGVGSYVPRICTDGGWGFPSNDCLAATPAVVNTPAPAQAAKKDLKAAYDDRKTVRFYFDTAKSELSADDENKLNNLKASKIFIVRGYADARGSVTVNQKLSTDRAHQVADFLKQKGFDTTDASITGLGPISSALSGKEAKEARRVEVIFE